MSEYNAHLARHEQLGFPRISNSRHEVSPDFYAISLVASLATSLNKGIKNLSKRALYRVKYGTGYSAL